MKVWESTLKTYQSDWARSVWSKLKGNTVRTGCPELRVQDWVSGTVCPKV